MIKIVESNQMTSASPFRKNEVMEIVSKIKKDINLIPENEIEATVYINILDSVKDEELAINISIESSSEDFKDKIQETIDMAY